MGNSIHITCEIVVSYPSYGHFIIKSLILFCRKPQGSTRGRVERVWRTKGQPQDTYSLMLLGNIFLRKVHRVKLALLLSLFGRSYDLCGSTSLQVAPQVLLVRIYVPTGDNDYKMAISDQGRAVFAVIMQVSLIPGLNTYRQMVQGLHIS